MGWDRLSYCSTVLLFLGKIAFQTEEDNNLGLRYISSLPLQYTLHV